MASGFIGIDGFPLSQPKPMIGAMNVPHLRSPHVQTGGIVYFARMLDKARLHAAGQLPADYQPNLGGGFDARCVDFLHVKYDELIARALRDHRDEETLEWAFGQGRRPTEQEIEVWNGFMTKRGWNDDITPMLRRRLKEGGFEDRTDIETMFEYIDLDEGRDPRRSVQ